MASSGSGGVMADGVCLLLATDSGETIPSAWSITGSASVYEALQKKTAMGFIHFDNIRLIEEGGMISK